MAMRLASSGWWGGDPEKVLSAPADLVMAAAQYEFFKAEYERTYMEMNKEKP